MGDELTFVLIMSILYQQILVSSLARRLLPNQSKNICVFQSSGTHGLTGAQR
jgi:hemolysin-activating ACP:hemolysin acyltransferase